MKQSVFKIAFLAACTTALISCQGFVDSIFGVEDNPVVNKPTTQPVEEEENSPTEPMEPQTSAAALFANEAGLKSAVASVYQQAVLMMTNQQTLEAFRLKKIDAETFGANYISSENDCLYNTWSYAYNVIGRANILINELKTTSYDFPTAPYLAEVTALRSWAYYQLAILWGNVPLVTENTELSASISIPQTSKNEILTFAYIKLDEVKDDLTSSNQLHFGKLAAYTLMAELLLTLDDVTGASKAINDIKSLVTADYFIIKTDDDILSNSPIAYKKLLNGATQVNIYSKAYFALLSEEASGNTDGLADSWLSSAELYGIWPALIRLNAAKIKTGCSDIELLMPVPQKELYLNNMLIQNPGY